MKLRRRYLTEAKANGTFQKCLALALVLKSRLVTSRISNYSTNKLSKAAGIAYQTARKYEEWMERLGLIHFEGNLYNRVLVVNAVSSHTSSRNFSIDEMDLSTFSNAYRSVQSLVFMKKQHDKDYMRHLLQARHKPSCPEEFRKAKRKVKHLVETGVLRDINVHYKEWGLSLKRIAEEIGCCVRTAQRVVGYAVDKEWTRKIRRFYWVYAPHVNHLEVEGYTFATRHKLCIVQPNIYPLSKTISAAFHAPWYMV